jgi:drug/metabolite transporter (DMT)-like permease
LRWFIIKPMIAGRRAAMNLPFHQNPRGLFDHPPTLAYIGLVLTMVVWAMVPVFLKILLTVLTPIELSFSRFFLSGFILLGWVGLKQRHRLVVMFQSDLKLVLLCTLFGPLTAMVCFNFGILHVTIGTAAVFAALEPFFTYLLAVMLGQEDWQPQRMASIMAALAGMTLVVFSRSVWGVSYWVSLLLVTLSPMIWAANSIITKELVKRHSPIVMSGASFVLSSLLLIPFLSPAFPFTVAAMDATLWIALIYCVASNILGFSIWYWSLKFLPPSSVAVTMYLIPILSVAAGVVILHEPLSSIKIIGILMVLSGLYFVNFRWR